MDRIEVCCLLSLIVCGSLFVIAYVSLETPAIVVLTGSMMPTLAPGDLVLIQRAASVEIDVGDIVVFKPPEDREKMVTVHRVVEKRIDDTGSILFYTKGDASPNLDNGYLTPSDLIGRVFLRVPMVGRILVLLRSPSVILVVALSTVLYFWYRREEKKV